MAKQANASLEQADDTVRRMIRETYKWLVAPMQEARPGKGLSDLTWEHFQVNPGAQNWSQEIERVLKENELLITEWAPIHLAKVLKDWFWKDEVKETSLFRSRCRRHTTRRPRRAAAAPMGRGVYKTKLRGPGTSIPPCTTRRTTARGASPAILRT